MAEDLRQRNCRGERCRRNHLGGGGAESGAEMARACICSVSPGLTIAADACSFYYQNGRSLFMI